MFYFALAIDVVVELIIAILLLHFKCLCIIWLYFELDKMCKPCKCDAMGIVIIVIPRKMKNKLFKRMLNLSAN